ncbi:MAG TPA: methylmalonyl-CoA mutase family protein [Hyphomicrobiaceae bacterium]|nr:methylmalonyl-CoA mutase family protein [Hyphomicrobiaceae bacterium]
MTDDPEPLSAEFEAASREAWLKLVDKALKGGSFERLVSHTADGLRIEPLGTPAAMSSSLAAATNKCGSADGWDIRQRHAEPDPRLCNAAIREDLEGGVNSLLLQIEAPGQSGLGYGAEPLATALKGVRLPAVLIALEARENTMDAVGSLLEIWRENGVEEGNRHAAFNLDPLGVLAKTGTLYYPADRACAIAAEFAADAQAMPNVKALLADGRPYHEAGASEAQELAAMLATTVAYLRACEAGGQAPGVAFDKIAFALASDADLFVGIAKLRAARRLLRRVAEACGSLEAANILHLTAFTSERMMARRDPWVNMLRTTVACAAAAFGGADAISVLPFTWALGKPDRFALRIARNTHLILQEESALGRVIDPAHGAWLIERLTADLMQKAWELFQAIEAQGGMARALESGFLQEEVGKVADARARRIAHGQLELTGVSAFPRLAADGVSVAPHPAVAAVVRGGTSVTALPLRRLAEPFERLRDAADAHLDRGGRRPQVFLAALGETADHSGRITWMKNFLAAGGIEAVVSPPLHSSAEAGKAFADSNTDVVSICASDAVYAELAEATAGMLKTAGAKQVLIAGRLKQQQDALRAAGVDDFVFAGCDAITTLSRLHEVLDVRA